MARARSSIARLRAAVGILALASLALASCSSRERLILAEAGPGEAAILAALLADNPLPSRWRLVDAKAAGGEGAEAVLRLSWLRVEPAGAGPAAELQGRAEGRGTAGDREAAPPRGPSLGRRYLAAAAGLSEPIYSLGRGEAEARGLEPLDGINLPRRALAVEGLWPGEDGYPFAEELVLSLKPAGAGNEEAGLSGGAETAEAPGRGAKEMPKDLARWLARIAAGTKDVPALSGAGAREGEPIVLGALGDLAIADSDAARLSGGASGLEGLFGSALPALSRPDFLVGNLEGVVSALGEPNPRKRFRFRFPPEAPRALAAAGLDLFLFANNHGFDYGPEAFADSLSSLEAAGTLFAGAGRSLAEAARAVRVPAIRSGGPSLAFVGFARYPDERYGFTVGEAAAGPGRAGVLSDEAAALGAIGKAAAAGDFVVVLAHGGDEYRFEPSRPTRELYRRFIDAGADLVLGSHPHVLQGAEAYGGGLIAYSLGNFLFTADAEPPEALRSAMLELLVLGGAVRGLRLEPVLALEEGTRLDPDRAGAEARFAARCAELAAAP